MQEKTIICVSGAMESGKTTVSNFLVNNYHYNEIGFADHLKTMCVDVFDMGIQDVYSTEGKKRKFKSPKYLNISACLKILGHIEKNGCVDLTHQNVSAFLEFIKDHPKFTTPREILQVIGTDICRNIFDQDYHIYATASEILRSNENLWVISDGRFKNERDYIRKIGGKLVLVIDESQDVKPPTHSSEAELGNPDEYDYVILNNKEKGLDYLEKEVYNMLKGLELL